MRIISWNMQGQVIPPGELTGMLNSVGADALIVQEAADRLTVRAAGSRHSPRRDPPDLTWTETRVHASSDAAGRDSYLVAVNGSTTVRTVVCADPTEDARPNMSRQWLVAVFEKGGEKLRVATCHAPYGLAHEAAEDRNCSAVAYMLCLFNEMDPAGGGTEPEKHTVDVFMGDTNVYFHHECAFNGWVNALTSATSGQGKGNPLDRILVRRGKLDRYRCGRICAGAEVIGLSPRDAQSGAADLVVEGTDDQKQKWMVSDHLPIYLDTAPVGAGAAFAPDPDPAGPARKRRSDADLVELDDRGREKKQRTSRESAAAPAPAAAEPGPET